MRFADTKLGRRVARMAWRYKGLVHGKKGVKNRYTLRARQILDRRIAGGIRWKRIKDLGKDR